MSRSDPLGCWTLGLLNSTHKYLSAESFGFRVNCSGKSMKKKQVWLLEPFGDGDSVCLKSHLDKYLAVDQFGNVTCHQDEKDAAAKFEISVCEDHSGRWAFRSVVRGYFLGGTSDSLACAAKCPGDAELWHVHLAAKPQVIHHLLPLLVSRDAGPFQLRLIVRKLTFQKRSCTFIVQP